MRSRMIELWGSGSTLEVLAPSAAQDERMRAWLGRMERQAASPGGMPRVLCLQVPREELYLRIDARVKEMIAAAKRRKLLLGAAQIFRFEESTNRLRQRLQAGEIGRPVFARAEFSYWGRKHARSWINDLAISGGGPIADVGVHCIDVLRFILDDEVTSVQAVGAADEESGEVESAAVLSLQFAKGTLASVLVSTRAQYRTPLEFVGEAGVLFANNGLTVDRPVTLELRREGRITETEQLSNHLAYARQVDAFAAAVEGKQAFPAPGEEGLRNQLVLDAAYRSLKSGQRELIPRRE